jgi:hypothetical protein
VLIASAGTAGFTTTVACACLVVSAALVAVTVILAEADTVGALNNPLLETEPAVADQFTAVLVVPCTVATNCFVLPDVRVELVGEIEMLTTGAAETATVAVACTAVFAALVAVIVTVVLLVTLGAVNKPLLEMLPAVADQVTAVLLVPCTRAENCCVAPEATLTLVGDTEMLTVEGAGETAPLIVICACNFAVEPCASATLTQNELVAAIVGVPVIAPVLVLRVTPAGNAPEFVEKVYGVTPPTAEIFPEYALPTLPAGRLAVTMMRETE